MFTLGRGPRYCAWMLRCWEVGGDEADRPARWRCSLGDPHTRDRRGFADLAVLAAVLGAELGLGCDRPLGDGEERGTSQARRSSGGCGEGGPSAHEGQGGPPAVAAVRGPDHDDTVLRSKRRGRGPEGPVIRREPRARRWGGPRQAPDTGDGRRWRRRPHEGRRREEQGGDQGTRTTNPGARRAGRGAGARPRARGRRIAEAARAGRLGPDANPGNTTFIAGTDGADTFGDPYGPGTIICGFGGNDSLLTARSGVTFDGGDGNDSVSQQYVGTFDGGVGDNRVYDLYGGTCDGGPGTDAVYGRQYGTFNQD